MAAPAQKVQEIHQAIAQATSSVAVVAMLDFLTGSDETKRQIFAALSSPLIAELPSVIQAGIAELGNDLARIIDQVRRLIKSNLRSAGLRQDLARDVLSVYTEQGSEVIASIVAEM
ncbi:hypothetical protein MAPG_11651 [Magnaporthiopsis poae ATCC 64411]|uniref:Uncharacterized protein n=1 Tax=Magnaporthiopsis poae (strain ATCC 64411 / 73-15) TaxID=644358 RepID=A0A0C4EFU4_MAGP6|nr:hypothetical protein MAPG_11651 [Magnaporthiopsis poae ATCC 64411]